MRQAEWGEGLKSTLALLIFGRMPPALPVPPTLMKMLPTPDLRKEGSFALYIMRMGLPFMTW